MINEEVTITHNDISYKVGVVEFDRDWSPFDAMLGEHHWFKHPEDESMEGDDETSSVNSSESDELHEDQENDKVQDDGISETMEDLHTQFSIQDEDLEEGEIVEETPSKTDKVDTPAIIIPAVSPIIAIDADAVMEEAIPAPAINQKPSPEAVINSVDPIQDCNGSDSGNQAQLSDGPLPFPICDVTRWRQVARYTRNGPKLTNVTQIW